MHPIILIGGGEHACVVTEAIRTGGGELLGYVDPAAETPLGRTGVPRLGDDSALRDHRDAAIVLGFGSLGPAMWREGVAERLTALGHRFATVIDATAVVSPTATIGEGTVILAGAIVQTGAVIGRHCVVNTGAVIEHHVQLADHVQVAPRVAIGGGTAIGARAFIGLGACVRDHVHIGSDVTVAMGSVVIDDIIDGSTVYGVPARPRLAHRSAWSYGDIA